MADPKLYDLNEVDPRFGAVKGVKVGTRFESRYVPLY
jgi:hypothetical protein